MYYVYTICWNYIYNIMHHHIDDMHLVIQCSLFVNVTCSCLKSLHHILKFATSGLHGLWVA